jgi:hypothetical protein
MIAVLPGERCSCLLGNPPLVGKKEQSPEQKADVAPIFAPLKGGGVLGFVAECYVKAAQYITFDHRNHKPALYSGGVIRATAGIRTGTSTIRCAFVSTNSITQGEQVGVLRSTCSRRASSSLCAQHLLDGVTKRAARWLYSIALWLASDSTIRPRRPFTNMTT